MDTEGNLFVETPLIESLHLSQLAGVTTYLKLENTQPSGSFKLRGISRLCEKAVFSGCKILVTSSGGNAGLAVTYCAHRLGVKAHVIVPGNSSTTIRQKLKDEGAVLEVYGRFWNQANERALQLTNETEGAIFIPPFDHPDIWDGHGTMVEEMVNSLGPETRPAAVVLSVGGGGLASGAIGAMRKLGWQDVPVLAVETVGADCFNKSVMSGIKVTLEEITSIATCLGSLVPCDQILSYLKVHNIISHVVTDREAVDACIKFADDHKILVEPACGASLSAVYSGFLRSLRKANKIGMGPIIIIVCGGSNITCEQLMNWKREFDL